MRRLALRADDASRRRLTARGRPLIIARMCRSVLLAACVGLAACRAAPSAPEPGRAPPRGPELYGAGLFSSSAWDFCLALAPDQSHALFCRADDGFSRYTILETRRGPDGHWSPPASPTFARRWSNADPHLTADGASVYFISNRPLAGDGDERSTHELWWAERDAQGAWGAARRVPEPVNLSGVDVWGPSVAGNGNLYFGAERPGGAGGADLWVARRTDGGFQAPENLGDAINTAAHELDVWIARDESYMIFAGLNRSDAVGGYDLYVSRRRGDAWETARPLHAVNTAAYEFTPSVSPDGKWLYFSSTRRHTGALGERLDVPRDERAVAGIGDGKKGDLYRIAIGELGLADPP
jgi:hypothetical protein